MIKRLNISSSVELIKLFKSNKNNLITINIDRIIDNNIRDYYEYDGENNFLKKNKTMIIIKNNNLKHKRI